MGINNSSIVIQWSTCTQTVSGNSELDKSYAWPIAFKGWYQFSGANNDFENSSVSYSKQSLSQYKVRTNLNTGTQRTINAYLIGIGKF